MLLTIDVGNTNIKYGLFNGDRLVEEFRVATDRAQTADEYGLVLRHLLEGLPGASVDGAILSSVVPPVTSALVQAVRGYLGLDPLVVRHGIRTGLVNQYETPHTLGADRLVASAAAAALYGAPVIVVACGTATVFNVVSAERAFLGGAIAPGLRTAADALARAAARLTRIELAAPPSVIGRTTHDALQSGAVYGFVALIEGILARLRATFPLDGPPPTIVGTGGLVHVVAPLTTAIDVVDPDLTLTGLRLLWEMNPTEDGRRRAEVGRRA